jgi:hypothetical protein
MGNHSKPSEQRDPGKPWKPRRLVILAAVPCLAAAAIGGAALASGGSTPRTPLTVNLDGEAGTTGLGVTVYACLASGRLTHVTVAAAPNCPAGSPTRRRHLLTRRPSRRRHPARPRRPRRPPHRPARRRLHQRPRRRPPPHRRARPRARSASRARPRATAVRTPTRASRAAAAATPSC